MTHQLGATVRVHIGPGNQPQLHHPIPPGIPVYGHVVAGPVRHTYAIRLYSGEVIHVADIHLTATTDREDHR